MKKYSRIASRALIGFIIGSILGGFLGLVIGGTFLGWINFRQIIGLEGYELTFYLGIIIGAALGTIRGIKIIK